MVTNFLNQFDDRLKDYNELLSTNQIFLTRTKNLGVITAAQALDWGLTGPNLRASGINYDVRKAMPYSSYEKFQFNVPLGRNDIGIVGDCWNRYWLRIEEMVESCKIIKQAMDSLPTGKYAADIRKIKPAVGEAYTAIENPRGELGFYLMSDGTEIPTRCKVRAPSFVNLAIMSEIGKNNLIADLIAILGSIDIVLGEIDR
jgi:NADH-quinone oxidoreductase subunit D